MKKIFLFLFLLVSFSYATDQCGFVGSSEFSYTLDASNLSDGRNDRVRGWDTDTYYVNVTEPGTVTVSVTGTNVFFSYDESACPGTGQGLTTATYTFPAATDFNLRVYTTNWGNTNYTITVSFTPSSPPAQGGCSSQIGEGTLNEVYSVGNTNFLEVKVFDPYTTDYSGWSILYCDDGDEIGDCSNIANLSTMTQDNVFWFYQNNVPNLPRLNSVDSFSLLLVDSSNNLIDMLAFNGATLGSGSPVTCTFPYDTTVDTTSQSKGVSRFPDGTGDWGNSAGQGKPTDQTPGDSNDGLPSSLIIAEYRMDECYWDGTAGEVIDSTAIPYNGTSYGDANTSVNMGGGVCYNGNFLSNYVELPSSFPHINGSRTIMGWFHTTNVNSTAHQRIFADDEYNNNGSYALSLGDPGAGRVRFYIRGLNPVSLDATTRLAQNTWYFAAATFDIATMRKTLYVYDAGGTLIEEVSQTVTGSVGTPTGNPSLGGEVDGGEVQNRFIGFLDEVKLFGGVLSQTDIETIINNEIAGNNYDGSARICGCGGVITPKNGSFNAVDIVSSGCNAQSHWNNNITTKIVNDDLHFSVLAKDIDTDLPMEANITKIRLVYYSDGDNSACSGSVLNEPHADICTNCGVTDANGCLNITIDKSLNDYASRCVEVLIEGKDKDDMTGVSLNDSNASDNFSTRPDTYECDGVATGTLIAEHQYASTFIATPLNLNTKTMGYTTSSVFLTANKYMRTGDLNMSLSGAMTPSTLSFVDGNTSIVNVSFNNVGDIGIDLNDSIWANVDSDDTAVADRVIHAECRRLFRPDHFLVQVSRPLLENNSTDFTYLSNLTPSVMMSAWVRDLNVTIIAQGEANATMTNYSAPNNKLYANDVTLSPELSLPLKHSSATKLIDLTAEDSATITGFSFVNGVSVHGYNDVGFNYDRSFNTPINPFVVDGSETYFSIAVEDNTYPSVIGDDNTSSDGNVTFYYGRLNPSDITATLLTATNPLPMEVYDDANSVYIAGMKQNSLFWYLNDLHSGNAAGHTFEAIASSNTLIDNVLAGFGFTYNSVIAGEQDLDITAASTNKGTIHLKTQEWLWYVPAGFGSAYDDTAGSDCTMHPCFTFSLVPNNSVLMIESGDFNGTTIPDVNRSDYIQKGVKLFR